jgi:hypothetical protein
MANANKATHSGHCQACGRLQKLPHGYLAKHGYTIALGFFSGTCMGSELPPFEKSCELVKTFIATAQAELSRVRAKQAALRVPPTEPKGWVRNYEADGISYGNVHRWRYIEVLSEKVTFENGTPEGGFYYKHTYIAPGPTSGGWSKVTRNPNEVHNVPTDNSYNEDGLSVAHRLNCGKADWFEVQARDLQRYIAWQTERVTNWKEAELLPVDAKSKLGFAPTKQEERV